MTFVGVHLAVRRSINEVWRQFAADNEHKGLPARLTLVRDPLSRPTERFRTLIWRESNRKVDEALILAPKPYVIVNKQRCNAQDSAHFSCALYEVPQGTVVHISGFAPLALCSDGTSALEIACELAARSLMAIHETDTVSRLRHSIRTLERARLGAYGQPLSDWLQQCEEGSMQCLDISLLYFVVKCLMDEGQPTALRTGLSPAKLRKVQRQMLADLSTTPLVEDLARAINLSQGHFSRAFRLSCGEAPLRWLMRMRVERAMELLSGTEQSLANIALECGFANQAHFTRVFTAHSKSPPATWRRRLCGNRPAGDVVPRQADEACPH